MAGGSSFIVFRASPHAAAARKLIEFLSEPAQQVRFFELTGDLPARRSAWQSPALTSDPHLPAFLAQLERVAPLPRVPEWEQIATQIFDRGEAVARGTIPVQTALRQLDAKADELLEKRRWMLSNDGGRPLTRPSATLSPLRGARGTRGKGESRSFAPRSGEKVREARMRGGAIR